MLNTAKKTLNGWPAPRHLPATKLAHLLPRLRARAASAGIPIGVFTPLSPTDRHTLRERCAGLPVSLIDDLDAMAALTGGLQLAGTRIDLTTITVSPLTLTAQPRSLFPVRLELAHTAAGDLILIDLVQPRLADCPVFALLSARPLAVRLADRFDDWLDDLGRMLPIQREGQPPPSWRPFMVTKAQLAAYGRAAEQTARIPVPTALAGQDWVLAAWAAVLPPEARITDLRGNTPGQAFFWGMLPPFKAFQRHPDFPIFAMVPLPAGRGLLAFISGSERGEIKRSRALLSQGRAASLLTGEPLYQSSPRLAAETEIVPKP
jgi:hypothetical protein